MAITKILYRNGGLAQAIQYITNPDKTDQCVLVDHFNCDPGFAYQQMMNTKRRFHKTDGRQCYHIIQSFKPDEISPELAHEIAKRFAAEHLRGYEAVIGTHVDKGHIHSHIVFNSVNADTGIKYHSTLQNYYQQIRGISDRLCAENGLSVILQGERTKTVSYIEWLRQSKGQPTFRSMLEADLRDAITDANDLGHFFLLMEHKGYEIHHGNRLGFRLRGQECFMYPERKNAAFSEENIERTIAGNLAEIEAGIRPAFVPRPKPQPYRPHPKYKGFLALYYHYCYLLGRIEKRQYPPRMTPHLRQEIMKAETYKARLKFPQENGIATADDLAACMQQAENKVAQLAKQRTILNVRKKKRKKLFDALAAGEALAASKALYEEGISGMEDEYAQYALLVLFFVIGVIKTCGSFTELRRPEIAFRCFIRFVLAQAAVTYGMELMTALFSIAQGAIQTIMGASGLTAMEASTLPAEIASTIEDVGLLESIPLWAVTLLGSLFIWVLSLVMILTVYGRFFKLYMATAIAPIPLSSFAGQPSSSIGMAFIKSYAAICLEGCVILLACVIFSQFASSPPVVTEGLAPATVVWNYVGELVFNMLVLVGSIKMSDRIIRELMGLG